MQTVRVVVKGLVQGVFYRHQTRETALSLGIAGWVRNRSDGAVELEACGSKEKLEHLIEWCKKGPPRARVDSIEVDWPDALPPDSREVAAKTFEVVADRYL